MGIAKLSKGQTSMGLMKAKDLANGVIVRLPVKSERATFCIVSEDQFIHLETGYRYDSNVTAFPLNFGDAIQIEQ